MSRDMIFSTTVAPCAKDRIGMSDGLLGIGGGKGRHHRDVIGFEQPLDLDRIEPLAAVGQRRGDDLPRGIDIGHKLARHGRRNLRQRLHHLAMPHQMHEAAHRVVFGRIIRNAGAAQRSLIFWSAPTQTASTGFGDMRRSRAILCRRRRSRPRRCRRRARSRSERS